ncbi:L-ribulose-5-phosphate 4-epimerase AraD [Acidobacteria bacterium AH-259-A15]|nr:L-ribulose-5-phosphate 4-epimerase AraD [Acidobacteria bacterium AH-259-A15]
MTKILEDLREEVLQANLELVRLGLVVDTFGNASGISREEGLVVIKPSGVDYESLKAQDLVVTDLEGQMVEGDFRPSSDLATHLMLYRSLAQLGAVVHTHSRYATAWAQAGREIPPLGTTHADYFYGPVPVTEWMEAHEIEQDYELNTGCVIVRRFAELDPESMPAVLVAGHGPFCWGASAREAAHVAVLLEEVARIAYYTVTLNSAATSISQALLDKHFLRKHGPGAYYGQK